METQTPDAFTPDDEGLDDLTLRDALIMFVIVALIGFWLGLGRS